MVLLMKMTELFFKKQISKESLPLGLILPHQYWKPIYETVTGLF